jgi:hypothetical protein
MNFQSIYVVGGIVITTPMMAMMLSVESGMSLRVD